MNTSEIRPQRLADLRFMQELPRNAIDKVHKRALRDGYGSLR